MNYFEYCQSVEEARKQYKKLLMQYHPDHAGTEGENIQKIISLDCQIEIIGY
jgi:DnaJ-class molecular chaperone